MGVEVHRYHLGLVAYMWVVGGVPIGIRLEPDRIPDIGLPHQATRWLARCRPEEAHESAVPVVAFGSA